MILTYPPGFITKYSINKKNLENLLVEIGFAQIDLIKTFNNSSFVYLKIGNNEIIHYCAIETEVD